jgi:carbonic anhydrase/acetyltransferase-like protein (isoleucine patch superfamily)
MLEPYRDHQPTIDATSFVHHSAVLIGRVSVGPDSSIWPTCVLRGDVGPITVGARSNIQDGAIIHLTHELAGATVGDDVTVGHRAIIHGCTVGNKVLVGMGAIILDNAVIGEYSLIGAGALITANKVIPPRSYVLGNPAKVVREVTDRELMMIEGSIVVYVEKAREFLAMQRRASVTPAGTGG